MEGEMAMYCWWLKLGGDNFKFIILFLYIYITYKYFLSVQSVQSRPTPCDPMECSTAGFPVHHQLPELTQTHVHWLGDAIQPSHPLSSLSSHLQSFPASGFFHMSQFFTSGGQRIGVSASTSVFPVNTQEWFPLGWTGWISLQSKGLSRSSPTPQFKGINSVLS